MAARAKWGTAKDLVTSSGSDADAQLDANLEDADPELCIRLLQVPTVTNYSGLLRRLQSSTTAWRVQFLELRGLDLLLEALERVSGRGCLHITDALLQLKCVACVRAVMNSKTGLDFMLDNQGYVRTLAQALDTSNMMVKMEVFRLLSCITLYKLSGHQQTVDALEHYKSLKKQQYRFSVIMNELHATDNVDYLETLMGMVNTLLHGLDDLRKRDKLRKEFIGLQLLDLLPRLRDMDDMNLNHQCETFENSLAEDEDDMMEMYGGINMSSHQDVFTSLFTRVSSTPASLHLLSVLQALLLVSPNRTDVWGVLETLVDRAMLLSQDDQIPEESAEQLLSRFLPSKALPPPVSPNRRLPTTDMAVQTVLMDSLSDLSQTTNLSPPPPPPPPPLPPCLGGPPPPPPPPPLPPCLGGPPPPPPPPPPPLPPGVGGGPPPPPPLPPGVGGGPPPPPPLPPGVGGGPPPPPPPPLPFGAPPPPPPPGGMIEANVSRGLGRAYIKSPPPGRCPTQRMKKLNWQKMTILEGHSMWTSASSGPLEPNYTSIEELFALPKTDGPAKATGPPAKPKEISFIDGKKNLNLNIFLKQFRCSHEEFVAMIQRGDGSKFNVETLKQLLKLLPEKHEVENLRSYEGEPDKLADVDRFYLLLLAVPCYTLRIDCMLLSEETSVVLESLMPKAQLVEQACKSLKNSPRLPSFCKLTLDIGNFLNYGSHTGNAEGFKISTLLKLTETKATGSRITLLHHMIEEAEKNHPDLLKLPEDLDICDKAAGVPLESIQSEAVTLIRFLENTQKKVEASSAEDLKENYLSAIKDNLAGCKKLQEMFTSIEEEKRTLAVYLCEDPSRLDLQDVFNTLKAFRALFIKAYKENHSRREQAVKVERRRKQQQEEESKRPKGEDGKRLRKTVAVQEEGCIIDNLLADIRKGFCLKKSRSRPDADTLPPDANTLAPDPDTLAPDPNTLAPDPDTLAPDPNTLAPDPDTLAPDPDTLAPDAYTLAPDPDTLAPDAYTLAPDSDTLAPDAYTLAPDSDTLPPAGTTEDSGQPEPPHLPGAPEPAGLPEPQQSSPNTKEDRLYGSTVVLSFSDLPVLESSFPSPPATPPLTAEPRPLITSSPDWRVREEGGAERPNNTNAALEGAGEEGEGAGLEDPVPSGGGSEGGAEPGKDTVSTSSVPEGRSAHGKAKNICPQQ
ncbi:inverted formin-2-like [Gadus macrocephalus]|uniref:inverted formin-2-like n=1 Tax=Gadus macrocephalus TaxID=80720 RepID=UPI0028CB489C|nr:inverted formin-2-like [Gadus macrocephalus]XP_059897217.1 inverted formin-2-like [Gadus macrocephalus]XP_059897218.1 inverted formin-2-like [Gadus macrocephalus]